MSQQMITTFFPAANNFINSGILRFASACPEISTQSILMGRNIRQPVLGLVSFAGTFIGIGGAVGFYRKQPEPNAAIWAITFLAFGFMNLSAIWLHCLLPSPSNTSQLYSEIYPTLWMIDTWMTGISATGLFVGSLTTHYCQHNNDEDWWNRLFYALQGIGLVCLMSFVLDSNNSFPLELWYLMPTVAATLPVINLLFGPIISRKTTSGNTQKSVFFPEWSNEYAPGEIGSDDRKNGRVWTNAHSLLISSIVILTVLGIGMDRFWCWAIYSRQGGGAFFAFAFWDLLTLPTLTFLGCDLAFLGILKYLNKH